jgi:hypothetical protein
MVVRLCTVAADQDHLVGVPLEQAQVPFTLDRSRGSSTVVLIDEVDVDRARTALERFGTFREEETP